MRTLEKAKQTLLQKLIALSENNPDKSQLIPAYHRLIQKTSVDLLPVAAVDTLAKQSTKGATLEKNHTAEALKTSVGRLCNLLVGYASEAENVSLTTDLKALRTRFQKVSQDEFAGVCAEVVAEVRTLPEQWSDLGITEAGLASVEAQIALFIVQFPKSSMIKTKTKKAVKQRAAIFKMTAAAKEKIVNLASGFIGVDDEFHADIMEILAPKKRTPATVITVLFRSATTQSLLPNLDARLAGSKTMRKSNKKGESRFRFKQGGPKTIEVLLPNGDIRTFKDVDTQQGKNTTLIVEV